MMRWLLGWVLVVVCGEAGAVLTATPVVAGYANGAYKAAAGAYSMAAANSGYIAPAVVNVGGKAITMEATMSFAANAGNLVKNGLRLTPGGIVGSLALAWLTAQGIEWLNNEWEKGTAPLSPYSGYSQCHDSYSGAPASDFDSAFTRLKSYGCGSDCYLDAPTAYGNGGGYFQGHRGSGVIYGYVACWLGGQAQTNYAPATQSDFDALPDPLPNLGTELPHAPYMPDGAPVNAPQVEPQTVPIGDPYFQPDGSKAQDYAQITPQSNGDVAVVPFSKPVADAQGNPITNGTPTADPPSQQTDCDKYPNSLGCMPAGTPPTWTDPPDAGAPADPALVGVAGAVQWHNVYYAESGVCPLQDIPVSFMSQSVTVPLSSVCPYLEKIKFLVIALATIVAMRMFAMAPW